MIRMDDYDDYDEEDHGDNYTYCLNSIAAFTLYGMYFKAVRQRIQVMLSTSLYTSNNETQRGFYSNCSLHE